MARRTPGPVRFDPYYKIQVWQPRSLAWRDIQRAYDTPEAAWFAVKAEDLGETVRLMRITPEGRSPVTWEESPAVD